MKKYQYYIATIIAALAASMILSGCSRSAEGRDDAAGFEDTGRTAESDDGGKNAAAIPVEVGKAENDGKDTDKDNEYVTGEIGGPGDIDEGADENDGAGPTRTEDYKWKPHVYSNYLRSVYGEETEKSLYAWTDALMAGEDSVACPDNYTAGILLPLLYDTFPPSSVIMRDFEYRDDHRIYITYGYSYDGCQKIIRDFIRRTEEIVRSSVKKGDTPSMAALALYRAYVSRSSYDYDVYGGVFHEGGLTAYRGIMEYSGICQTFAPAYAYLCMQLDIDAIPVFGPNKEGIAHEWVLLRLNGKDYFADPTYEISLNREALHFFGMNGQRRDADGFNTAEADVGFNLLHGRDFTIDDSRFAPLWEAERVLEVRREGGVMDILCEKSGGERFTFRIED